jgi:hypothetical protein
MEPTESTTSNSETTVHAQYIPISPRPKSFRVIPYVVAAVIIVVMALGLLFMLERDGRVSTGIFDSIIGGPGTEAVARVNGEVILRQAFDEAVGQLTRGYTEQGVDVNTAETQTQIKDQAMQNLIDTALLLQAVQEKDLVVDEAAILERLSVIETGIGGKEALAARMADFGVTEAELREDIEEELLIQSLFETTLFTEEIAVSDEEVNEVYANAGGEEAGLPPLTEVREQIVESVRAEKQRGKVDAYLTELRAAATIERLI